MEFGTMKKENRLNFHQSSNKYEICELNMFYKTYIICYHLRVIP
jgi:hypothetical protein